MAHARFGRRHPHLLVGPLLEECSIEAGLADDRRKGAWLEVLVQRDGDCPGGIAEAQLHDAMAAALPDLDEPVLLEQAAQLLT